MVKTYWLKYCEIIKRRFEVEVICLIIFKSSPRQNAKWENKNDHIFYYLFFRPWQQNLGENTIIGTKNWSFIRQDNFFLYDSLIYVLFKCSSESSRPLLPPHTIDEQTDSKHRHVGRGEQYSPVCSPDQSQFLLARTQGAL